MQGWLRGAGNGVRRAARRPRSTSTAAAAPLCPRVAEQGEADDALTAARAMGRPYAEVPGPTPLPLIGNTWRLLPVVGELNARARRLGNCSCSCS